MVITDELKNLAKMFEKKGKRLYIVGGSVRDDIMGLVPEKIEYDLCSSATPKELIDMIENTPYTLKTLNGKAGVMAICGKSEYEHATFRKDIYDGMSHNPISVKFVDSLEEDAKRRDFKINAIYYDILKGEVIDPLGGIDDINNKILTTTRNPKIVYEDDPERVLRAVRFACMFNFKIPDNELQILFQNIENLKYLSKNRIKKEFSKMLSADIDYKALNKSTIVKMLKTIGEYDLWKYILPSLYNIQHSNILNQNGEHYYSYIINEVKFTPIEIRLSVMLKNIARAKVSGRKVNMREFDEVILGILESDLGKDGLNYTEEEMMAIEHVILGSDFRCRRFTTRSKIRSFIFDVRKVFNNVISMMKYTKTSDRDTKVKIKTVNILTAEYNSIVKDKYPFNNEELEIDSEDLIRGFPKIRLDKLEILREEILRRLVVYKKKNIKEDLMELATKEINSKPDFYLE